jgi:uncharacterized phage-associated protein
MVNINEVVGWIVRYDHSLNMESMQDSDLTNLKLQKLLYYVQGHYLAEFGDPLFEDDLVAWKHGPVVPRIYYHFKECLEKGNHDFIGFSVVESDIYNPQHINEAGDDFLKRFMTYYNKYSPWGLRNMTHEESPWRNTQNGHIIRVDLLKQFFGQDAIKNKLAV